MHSISVRRSECHYQYHLAIGTERLINCGQKIFTPKYFKEVSFVGWRPFGAERQSIVRGVVQDKETSE